MTSEMQVFMYSVQSKIRTIIKDAQVWFVAKDVCDVLGIVNPSDAISDLDNEDKNTLANSEGIRGNPNMAIISESGLYALIFKSRKPEAKQFKRWITSEVLPQIRKNGYYIDKAAVRQSPEKLDSLYSEAQSLRAEERNFSSKVKQYFTQATDYDKENEDTKLFFAGLQNLFLYAITNHTAAEIVVDRIDHTKERCGMVQDIPVIRENLRTSKNYLVPIELQQLRNLCSMYLAWLDNWQVRKYPVTMEFLRTRFLSMLREQDYSILEKYGHVKAKKREQVVSRELTLYKSRCNTGTDLEAQLHERISPKR